jgi:hypothetical protein
MGVRANEDEFGSFDPDEMDDAGTIGNAKAPASAPDDGLDGKRVGRTSTHVPRRGGGSQERREHASA